MGAHPLAYLHMCDLLGPTWFDGNFRVLFLIKLSIHICRQLSGFQGIAHAAYLKYGTYPARLNVFLAHWHGCIRNSAFFSMKCCRRGSPTLTRTLLRNRLTSPSTLSIEPGLCIIYLCAPLASVSIVFELSNQWQWPRGGGARGGATDGGTMADDRR